MRFTASQYDEAIAILRMAREQLKPDGKDCAICGDGGHQAWECSWNPLRAMAAARAVHQASHNLHETLHELCGYYSSAVVSPTLASIIPEPNHEYSIH